MSDRWPAVRSDRGDVPASVPIIGVLVFIVGADVVILIAPTDWSWSRRAAIALAMSVGTFAFIGLLCTVAVLGSIAVQRANRRLRVQMGPRLADWLNLRTAADLTSSDLSAWRRARRAGITSVDAQEWSDHGLPYTVASAARSYGVPRDQAVAVARAMRDAGLWDGADRAAITLLLAQHTRYVGDANPHPVIHRWARFSPAQLRAGARAVLGDPDVQRPGQVPHYRTSVNAINVLHALEHGEAPRADSE